MKDYLQTVNYCVMKTKVQYKLEEDTYNIISIQQQTFFIQKNKNNTRPICMWDMSYDINFTCTLFSQKKKKPLHVLSLSISNWALAIAFNQELTSKAQALAKPLRRQLHLDPALILKWCQLVNLSLLCRKQRLEMLNISKSWLHIEFNLDKVAL